MKIENIEKDKFNDKQKLIYKICNKENNLWLPNINEQIHDINLNTWFYIKESKQHNINL